MGLLSLVRDSQLVVDVYAVIDRGWAWAIYGMAQDVVQQIEIVNGRCLCGIVDAMKLM